MSGTKWLERENDIWNKMIFQNFEISKSTSRDRQFEISKSHSERSQNFEISKSSFEISKCWFRDLKLTFRDIRILRSRNQLELIFWDLEINIRDLDINIWDLKINIMICLEPKNNNIQIWDKRQKGTKVFTHPKWLPNSYFYYGGLIATLWIRLSKITRKKIPTPWRWWLTGSKHSIAMWKDRITWKKISPLNRKRCRLRTSSQKVCKKIEISRAHKRCFLTREDKIILHNLIIPRGNTTPAFGEPRHLIEGSDINVILLKTRHIWLFALSLG